MLRLLSWPELSVPWIRPARCYALYCSLAAGCSCFLARGLHERVCNLLFGARKKVWGGAIGDSKPFRLVSSRVRLAQLKVQPRRDEGVMAVG